MPALLTMRSLPMPRRDLLAWLLAFGQVELWSPLNSVFGDRLPMPDQTDQLRAALSQLAPGGFEVWVTHQVNVTALTGQSPAMCEGFVVDQQAKVLSRLVFL